ncbi:hypothetical protein CBR_g44523 [Chara braunii]|uniref:Uncharacterized protein n=1 Tax=Chara braunii TaxID=69332 RepID=A0A388LXM3_CHABU|nr:hypothetical protein CBR_g44523 [Chara braunii]|eukprot:GBG87067.1 hypothetical protein CBR_g44523 [Chara braunii]
MCSWRREDGVVLKRAQRHHPFRPPPTVRSLASLGASITVDLLPRRVRRRTHFRREERIQRKAAASSNVFGLFVGCGRTTHMAVERRIRLEFTAMEGGGEGGRAVLTPLEQSAVAAAVSTVVLRCQQERALGRMKEQLRARRRRTLTQAPDDGPDYVATSEAAIQLCYALGCGVILRATPMWWMKRRIGGTWEDLRQCDVTDDYFRDKLRMSPRVFREITEACALHLQRRLAFYREPLQPHQNVAYALYSVFPIDFPRASIQTDANIDEGVHTTMFHGLLATSGLVASMWLMRMVGDDLRSHNEAFYFAKLVAKPTLVSFIHRSFEHRRSVVRATNVVTERLGKANATLGEYLKYIPEWAPYDIVFGSDASISGLEDAKRPDRLGTGPLEDENDEGGKHDA